MAPTPRLPRGRRLGGGERRRARRHVPRAEQRHAARLAAGGRCRAEPDARWTVDPALASVHPDAQQAVTPGEPVQLPVEIFPTSAVLQAGHRLRVTIAAYDVPHALPPAPAALSTLAGPVEVLNDTAHPSSIVVPVVGAARPPAATDVAPRSPVRRLRQPVRPPVPPRPRCPAPADRYRPPWWCSCSAPRWPCGPASAVGASRAESPAGPDGRRQPNAVPWRLLPSSVKPTAR